MQKSASDLAELASQLIHTRQTVLPRRLGEPGPSTAQLAAIVGACDGELPLGVLIGAVAGLLDADPEDLRAEVLPQVRRLVADGYLRVG